MLDRHLTPPARPACNSGVPATDTTEKGLERLICTALTGHPCDPGAFDAEGVAEAGLVWGGGAPGPAGCGWTGGRPENYDREHCVDLVQLRCFLRATQPEVALPLPLHGWMKMALPRPFSTGCLL